MEGQWPHNVRYLLLPFLNLFKKYFYNIYIYTCIYIYNMDIKKKFKINLSFSKVTVGCAFLIRCNTKICYTSLLETPQWSDHYNEWYFLLHISISISHYCQFAALNIFWQIQQIYIYIGLVIFIARHIWILHGYQNKFIW